MKQGKRKRRQQQKKERIPTIEQRSISTISSAASAAGAKYPELTQTEKEATASKLMDHQYWLKRVENRGVHLQYASEDIRGDKTIVLAAVQQFGSSLEYATAEMQNNKEVVVASKNTVGH